MEWYFADSGTRTGPLTWEQLRALAAAGQLKPTDLVWHPGMSGWQPASSIQDLFALPPQQSSAAPLPPPMPTAPHSVDPALNWILPVNRSGWAIASGYLALFSVLGGCTAPFALFTGVMALREIKRRPGLGGRGRAIFGIVMGSVFTVLLVFLIAHSVATKKW